MQLEIFTVDAFTEKAFGGNPAAVCFVKPDAEEFLNDEVMQKIATEMNLSETAFLRLVKRDESFLTAKRFSLRWFTPTNEVPLCGHATLASAAAIFRSENPNRGLEFETLSGVLRASREAEVGGIKGAPRITLDFPLNAPTPVSASEWSELGVQTLIDAILPKESSLEVEDVHLSRNAKKLMIRLKSKPGALKTMKALRPDFGKMMTVGGVEFKGVILTLGGDESKTGSSFDFYSRYFSPWNGLPEDPVTGSAHTVLGPFWAGVLKKERLRGFQCSARGGDVSVELNGDRVNISGAACVLLEGKLSF